jgi:prepilin signal peptidase PulO-like enzyme (type II secretory pathway)
MITYSALHVLFLLAGGVVGVFIGVCGVRVAAVRNASAAIEQDPADEAALLDLLWSDPVSWLRVEELLKPKHFAVPEYSKKYEEFEAACESAGLGKYSYRGESDEEMEEAVSRARADGVGAELVRGDLVVTPEAILDVAGLVLSRGLGRELNSDRSGFVFNEDTLMLSRVPSSASPSRMSTVGALAGATSVLWAWSLLELGLSGWALVLGTLSAASLVAGSVVVGCVDLDTFYLDWEWFLGSGVLSWGGVVGADILSGHTNRIYPGLIVTAFVAGGFELFSRLYHTEDGKTQGAGDTWIVLVSVGPVAAFTGAWWVGLISALGGCVLVVVGALIRHRRHLFSKESKESPIPFGPYLAAGSVIAMVWWASGLAHG